MTELQWYTAESADDQHADEEVDLAKIGNPGGAQWAYVAAEGAAWSWGVLDRWLWEGNEDGKAAEYLAQGSAPTKDDAKAAVLAWVNAK